MFQELTVDLQRAPRARWHLTSVQCEQARELLTQYHADLGLSPDISEFLISTVKDFVRLITGRKWSP